MRRIIDHYVIGQPAEGRRLVIVAVHIHVARDTGNQHLYALTWEWL